MENFNNIANNTKNNIAFSILWAYEIFVENIKQTFGFEERKAKAETYFLIIHLHSDYYADLFSFYLSSISTYICIFKLNVKKALLSNKYLNKKHNRW